MRYIGLTSTSQPLTLPRPLGLVFVRLRLMTSQVTDVRSTLTPEARLAFFKAAASHILPKGLHCGVWQVALDLDVSSSLEVSQGQVDFKGQAPFLVLKFVKSTLSQFYLQFMRECENTMSSMRLQLHLNL